MNKLTPCNQVMLKTANILIGLINPYPMVKVQNFPNPELQKFKFLNLQDAYKNE